MFILKHSGGPVAVGVFPSDYCGLAWFACLCCCWPIGICAILSSNNVSLGKADDDDDDDDDDGKVNRRVTLCCAVLVCVGLGRRV